MDIKFSTGNPILDEKFGKFCSLNRSTPQDVVKQFMYRYIAVAQNEYNTKCGDPLDAMDDIDIQHLGRGMGNLYR